MTKCEAESIMPSVKLFHFTGDVMADKTYEMTLLFDYFGELLTEKQREYFDYYYSDDLSLSEISELTGVSRQGVRDNIVRAEKLLTEYEEKTGVVRRARELGAELERLASLALRLEETLEGEPRNTAKMLREGLLKLAT